MGRTWASLLEDEKHHEAETSHLPTTSHVLESILDYPAPAKLPVTTDQPHQTGIKRVNE